jgi:hypothetical protein
MVTPINATGWSQLIDGDMIGAAYITYNTVFGGGGWVILILFFVFQFMLFIKTKSLELSIITSLFFLAAFGFSAAMSPDKIYIIIFFLALELGGIFYMWLWG